MRYLLFAGGRYYPYGGAVDLQGAFDTIEDAGAAYSREEDIDLGDAWAHIFDLSTLKIVAVYDDETDTWGAG